jgi:hypothetical protein
MTYTTPVLKKLGPVTSLTLGNGGSCADGQSNNNADPQSKSCKA